jgi:hypothetical protein
MGQYASCMRQHAREVLQTFHVRFIEEDTEIETLLVHRLPFAHRYRAQVQKQPGE